MLIEFRRCVIFNSSAMEVTKEEILPKVMEETTGMSKSSKIPKKKPVPPASSETSSVLLQKSVAVVAPTVRDSHVIGGPKSVASQKPVVSEPTPVKTSDPHVEVVVSLPEDQPMESVEYEDMEWETTVQEISGFWESSHFKREECIEMTAVLETIDVDMERPTQLIIVPDTNVWIHDTKLISTLLEAKFDPYAFATIVIPWMVLQELDSNKGKLTRSGGRAAINFVHKLLSSRHPRFKGQKASDAAHVVPGYDGIEDDSILQCAEQFHSADTIVVLLTNDCNLRNKALVNNVKTCDARGGVNGIQKLLSRYLHPNFEFWVAEFFEIWMP